MREIKLNILCMWDAQAKVWVAESADLPGLVTEAATIPDLIQRIMDVAPELIADNMSTQQGEEDVLVSLLPTYQQTVRLSTH